MLLKLPARDSRRYLLLRSRFSSKHLRHAVTRIDSLLCGPLICFPYFPSCNSFQTARYAYFFLFFHPFFLSYTHLQTYYVTYIYTYIYLYRERPIERSGAGVEQKTKSTSWPNRQACKLDIKLDKLDTKRTFICTHVHIHTHRHTIRASANSKTFLNKQSVLNRTEKKYRACNLFVSSFTINYIHVMGRKAANKLKGVPPLKTICDVAGCRGIPGG